MGGLSDASMYYVRKVRRRPYDPAVYLKIGTICQFKMSNSWFTILEKVQRHKLHAFARSEKGSKVQTTK